MDMIKNKSILEEKKNLLSYNMKRFGDMNQALLVTKAQMLEQAAGKIDENALFYSNPKIKANADLLKSQIMTQQGQLAQQNAQLGIQRFKEWASTPGNVKGDVP